MFKKFLIEWILGEGFIKDVQSKNLKLYDPVSIGLIILAVATIAETVVQSSESHAAAKAAENAQDEQNAIEGKAIEAQKEATVQQKQLAADTLQQQKDVAAAAAPAKVNSDAAAKASADTLSRRKSIIASGGQTDITGGTNLLGGQVKVKTILG